MSSFPGFDEQEYYARGEPAGDGEKDAMRREAEEFHRRESENDARYEKMRRSTMPKQYDYPRGYLSVVEIQDLDLGLLHKQYKSLVEIQTWFKESNIGEDSWQEHLEGLINLCESIFEDHPMEDEETLTDEDPDGTVDLGLPWEEGEPDDDVMEQEVRDEYSG